MKNLILTICLFIVIGGTTKAQTMADYLHNRIYLKTPGNISEGYDLKIDSNGVLVAGAENIPLIITQQTKEEDGNLYVTITLKANSETWFNFQQTYLLEGMKHDDCQFYMPGFWYRRNLRSPKEAPSFYTSDSWRVREDRLSTPLTGILNLDKGMYYTVLRKDEFKEDALSSLKYGEAILSDKTSIGFTGFENLNGTPSLVYGFPSQEAPRTYIRKLTLDPAIMSFEHMSAGEEKVLTWIVKQGKAVDFSDFVAQVWNYSFDLFNPEPIENIMSASDAKSELTNYFTESYVATPELNYFSGVHMRTDDCKSTGSVEVGFVGRVLLNAFNALEYGEKNNCPDLVQKANSIFDSYLKYGFTSNGFFREFIDYTNNQETDQYSIRRQSEGAFALLHYLNYEKKHGRRHPEWEQKIKMILNNFVVLQNEDGSFPRKFDNRFSLIDSTGGSTPSATLPLVMGYSYFKDKRYLMHAKKTGEYLERELISKADYFSSTLDANCEDKEASLYAATATYYLSLVTKGAEHKKYSELTKKASYFALSWYYMWDVPFAKGQMLGDVDFKSRGWGNVSVENNHIDVFIFEFADVIEWLSKKFNEPRFAAFSNVIKTSMLQLMPVKGNMFNIGKIGYYPEVVQHTNWDYGKNGKGFYNDIFAPGWTVASLWELLSPQRAEKYLLD